MFCLVKFITHKSVNLEYIHKLIIIQGHCLKGQRGDSRTYIRVSSGAPHGTGREGQHVWQSRNFPHRPGARRSNLTAPKSWTAGKDDIQIVCGQEVTTNVEKRGTTRQQTINFRAVETVMVQRVALGHATQMTGGEVRDILLASNLPHGPVAETEPGGHHVVPPDHDATATILIALEAESVVMPDGDTLVPLLVSGVVDRVDGSSADPRQDAGERGSHDSCRRRQTARFLGEAVNSVTVRKTNMRRYPCKLNGQRTVMSQTQEAEDTVDHRRGCRGSARKGLESRLGIAYNHPTNATLTQKTEGVQETTQLTKRGARESW